MPSKRTPARSAARQRARAPRHKKNWRAALERLEHAELVRALPTAEYVFKHALVQDTAYQALLRNERKRLHHAVGFTLERAYAERGDEFAAELARHFSEAGDNEKFLFYAERAGDVAARVFAFAEAYGHFRAAFDVLAHLPDTLSRRRQRADIVVKIVSTSLRSQGPEKSLELLQVAEAGLQEIPPDAQDRERMARLHFWMGDAYSHLNQQPKAISYLQQVLDAAKQGISDEALLAIPLNVIGRALVAQGKFADAEPLLAQAAPLLEQSANWYEWVLAVGFLGFARAAQGDTDGGLSETTRAFVRARELQTPFGLGDSRIFTSFIQMQRGDYPKMLADANEALHMAKQHDDHLLIFLAYNVRGWAHARLGQLPEAQANFETAQRLGAQAGGHLFFADMFEAAYAELALRQGNMDVARERAIHAVEMARATGSVFSEGLAQRVWAQTLAHEPAAPHFAESIHLFEAGNAQIEAARARTAWDLAR